MKYAIYYRFKDGTFNTCNVQNAKVRDLQIKHIKEEFKEQILALTFCPIYKCGEYGQLTPVIGKALDAL